jgi:cytochrome b6-f complex iron-sulfur subunit
MTQKKKTKTENPNRKDPPGTGRGIMQNKTTRRNFLWTFWIVLGGVALIEMVAVAVNFFRPRKQRSGSGDGAVVVAGPIEQFEPDTVTAFPQGKFYLARLENGGFLALSRECTHLGCTVPWDSRTMRFDCPCHSSSFDIRGDVLSAPASRALDLYPIRIENGIVKVDTGRRMKRRSFHAGQVTFS